MKRDRTFAARLAMGVAMLRLEEDDIDDEAPWIESWDAELADDRWEDEDGIFVMGF